MKYILIILFFLTAKCEGQIINASSPYRVRVTAAGCSYLLDQYSGAAAAYSLRKLDCDYTGYAIRVRRSSDNTEQDIGFTSGGDLDTSSLKTFVSTGNGYVVTWYDQSGSKNVTQSTSAAQALIIDNGVVVRRGVKPALYFDGGDYYGATDAGLPTGAASYITVSYYANSSINSENYSTIFTYGAAGSGSTVFLVYGTSFLLGTNAISVSQYGNGMGNNSRLQLHNLQFVDKPSTTGTWYQYINNSISVSKSLTTNTTLSGAANSFTIGSFNAQVGISNYLVGNIQEIIMYGSDKSGDRTSIETNINSYYSIY